MLHKRDANFQNETTWFKLEPSLVKPISLNAKKIEKTVSDLAIRIGERFPESSLRRVGEQVNDVAALAQASHEKLSKPIWWARSMFWALIALAVLLCIVLPLTLNSGFGQDDWTWKRVLELGDPVFNEILVLGALFLFVYTLESKIKRHHALKFIQQLRSLAHVIDMHQLTKDPERLLHKETYVKTPLSPEQSLTPFELRRYLDYCSEMLSLIGKLAAFYIQDFDDEVVLASVNEIESLTTGLSNKIWQKIVILHQYQFRVDDD